MYLFKNELLRELPRPTARSYARPSYGPRYARRLQAPTAAPSGDRVALLPTPIPPDERPRFDRAA